MTPDTQARIEALEDRLVQLEVREAKLIGCIDRLNYSVELLLKLIRQIEAEGSRHA